MCHRITQQHSCPGLCLPPDETRAIMSVEALAKAHLQGCGGLCRCWTRSSRSRLRPPAGRWPGQELAERGGDALAQAGHSAQHCPNAAALESRQEAGHPLVLRATTETMARTMRRALQREEVRHWLRQNSAQSRMLATALRRSEFISLASVPAASPWRAVHMQRRSRHSPTLFWSRQNMSMQVLALQLRCDMHRNEKRSLTS